MLNRYPTAPRMRWKYYRAIFNGMKANPLGKVATPDDMELIIAWWYSQPALLAAIAVEDCAAWMAKGKLMAANELARILESRGIPAPCNAQHLLLGMRLAVCMDEREKCTAYLVNLLSDIETGQA